MYHGGLERDPFDGTPTERFTGENVGYQIALLEGIDVLITGHQHRSFIAKINTTPVVQTRFNALEFAEITIEFAEETTISLAIRKMNDYPRDLEIEAIAQKTEEKTQRWLDEALGHIAGPSLIISDPFEARLHKHPLVSFINQVQAEISGAQLSACALFNGVKGFASDITYRDIVATYIYPNTLVVKRMDKARLKAFLEKCAEYFSIHQGKIIVTPSFDDPKPQHFNYDMVDGIDYTINVSNPIGQRIVKMEYQGKAIDEDATFTIVMNNYRAVGGGDFMMVPECETVSEVNRDMSELLAEAIQKHKNYLVKHRDNIQVIQ
jgi:2',3'-cyclic-nucleotide 2'-phosphodiesterase/3'-nucleotidase